MPGLRGWNRSHLATHFTWNCPRLTATSWWLLSTKYDYQEKRRLINCPFSFNKKKKKLRALQRFFTSQVSLPFRSIMFGSDVHFLSIFLFWHDCSARWKAPHKVLFRDLNEILYNLPSIHTIYCAYQFVFAC